MSFVIIFFFFHLKSQESNWDVFSGRAPECQDHPVFSGRCLFPYGEKISRHPYVLFPWPAPPMTHSWGFHLHFIQVPAQMSLHQRGAPLHTHSVQNSILVTLFSASHAFITPHTTSRIYRFIGSLFVSPTGISALCEQGLDCFAPSCIPGAWNSAWFTGRHSIIGAGWRQNTNEIVIGFFFFQLYCNKNI